MKKPDPVPRPRGRPRSFDRDTALASAMHLFWNRGFEATGVQELADAMGLAPPSLYAAFGDKKALFRQAIEAYRAGPGGFARKAIEEGGSARAIIFKTLQDAAAAFTDPDYPPGCMVILAATNCGAGADDIVEWLRQKRGETAELWRDLIGRDMASCSHPSTCDPKALARFAMTLLEGMAFQARDGASRSELETTIRIAEAAWPLARDG